MTEAGRPIQRALELARARLALLQGGGEFAGLEELDRALEEACRAAAADGRPGDEQPLGELLAVQRAGDAILAAELAAIGARLRRLREGQAGNAAYRAGSEGFGGAR